MTYIFAIEFVPLSPSQLRCRQLIACVILFCMKHDIVMFGKRRQFFVVGQFLLSGLLDIGLAIFKYAETGVVGRLFADASFCEIGRQRRLELLHVFGLSDTLDGYYSAQLFSAWRDILLEKLFRKVGILC